MKNLKFKLLNFVYLAIAYFVLASLVVQPSVNLFIGTTVAALVVGTVVSLFNPLTGALRAIQVEIWENHIEQEIFKDNQFLRMSHNADDNVIAGKVVHIPQSGGSGNVVKNRTTLPATVRKRTDGDIIYLVDEYTTDPVLIPNADNYELSYDKRASVLEEDRDKIVQTVAEETIYNWLHGGAFGSYVADNIPAGQVLLTTGDVVNAAEAGAPGATGNRLGSGIQDLQRMRAKFKHDKRWVENQMYCLLDPEMEAQCFPANNVVTATYMANVTEAERREGVMYKAQGWKIMTRSSVVLFNTDGTIKAPGEASNTDDDSGSMFWYKSAVEYAFGGVTAFEKLGDPQFYGDVYSFLVRSGSRARRQDYKGIGLLRQAKSV